MATFQVRLYGTITRDIICREVDAESEAEVMAICASEKPMYRVQTILPATRFPSIFENSTSPITSDESLSGSSPPTDTEKQSKT